MRIIEPANITKAVEQSAKTTVERIIKQESEAAAKRVQERVVQECLNIAIFAEEHIDHMQGRNTIKLVVEIRDAKE